MKIKNQNRIPSKYVLLILIVVCGILMGAEQLTGGKLASSKFCGQLYHHSYAGEESDISDAGQAT